ncbi:hypothetical protein GCM10010971_36080 [Silvimonas amylolytica]|uniref:Type II secretory pathway, pseudopilin PulG n=2 Tax=Silvimonas amylolytica TaxID=449663 RepID=A0ABQ2PRB1_9NEIS|nr:hypothetical protein GCM10010971_36080 [Silvimonas amylolytica]
MALLVMTMLCTVLLWQIRGLLGTLDPDQRRQEITRQALGEARIALLNWAVQNGGLGGSGSANLARPGAFPCPDTHAPDGAQAGYQGDSTGTCKKVALRIGRIPHKSMQQPLFIDGSGERLWMAVVEGFEDSNSAILNPDYTPASAWFQGRMADGGSWLTSDGNPAVIVIMAPGGALAGQKRSTAADRLLSSNYLEKATLDGRVFNNTDLAKGLFVSGPVRDGKGALIVNDQITVIRRNELMQAVSARAAGDYQRLLTWWQQYKGKGRLPYPARFDDEHCTEVASAQPKTNTLGCEPDATVCRGRLPKSIWLVNELSSAVGASQIDRFKWMYRNRWEQFFYYSVSSPLLPGPVSGCAERLQLADADGLRSAAAVIISAGSSQSGQVRFTAGDKADLAQYLDPVVGFVDPRTGQSDPAINQRGWHSGDAPDALLAVPDQNSNDRLYRLVLPGQDNGLETQQWLLTH